MLAAYGTSGQFEPAAPPDSGIEVKWFGQAAAEEPPPPHLFLPQGYWYDDQKRVISDIHSRRFPLTFWLRDSWNNLWIATWGLGAAHVDLLSSRYQPLPFGLWNDSVEIMAYDQDALWLGGTQEDAGSSGLTKWEVGSREPEYLEPRFITGFSDDRITAMAFDDHNLWFGTRNGLTRYDLNKDIWRSYSQVDHLSDPRITDLYLDDLYLWVASEAGLSRILKSSVGKKDSLVVEIIDFPRLGRMHISFFAPQGDTLWAGTDFGLYYYNSSTTAGRSGVAAIILPVRPFGQWSVTRTRFGLAPIRALPDSTPGPASGLPRLHSGWRASAASTGWMQMPTLFGWRANRGPSVTIERESAGFITPWRMGCRRRKFLRCSLPEITSGLAAAAV